MAISIARNHFQMRFGLAKVEKELSDLVLSRNATIG